jgi:hypothetical protein
MARKGDELAAAQRRQTEPSEAEDAFMSLGADAELDQVIFRWLVVRHRHPRR